MGRFEILRLAYRWLPEKPTLKASSNPFRSFRLTRQQPDTPAAFAAVLIAINGPFADPPATTPTILVRVLELHRVDVVLWTTLTCLTPRIPTWLRVRRPRAALALLTVACRLPTRTSAELSDTLCTETWRLKLASAPTTRIPLVSCNVEQILAVLSPLTLLVATILIAPGITPMLVLACAVAMMILPAAIVELLVVLLVDVVQVGIANVAKIV